MVRALLASLIFTVALGGATARAQTGEVASDDAAATEPGEPPAGAEPSAGEGGEDYPPEADGRAAEGAEGGPTAGAADPSAEAAPEVEAGALDAEVAREFRVLRTIEARLSVGEDLNAAQQAELVRLVTEGRSPEVRALAVAVLPWLPPAQAYGPTVKAAADESPEVRAQAMNGLVALGRRLLPPQEAEVRELALGGLDDVDDEVACGAARLLVAVDAEGARAELEKRADDASDVRFSCYRTFGQLPMRMVEVAAPVLPPLPAEAVPEEAEPSSRTWLGFGQGMFIVTSGAAGVVVGGLLPTTFFPPRDVLVYTSRTTRHAREEPNMLLGAGGALVGGAALGGAALGLTLLTGDPGFAPAASVLGQTVAGAAGGYGLGLALNLEEPWAGLSIMGGTLAGLAVSTPVAFLLPPTERDLTLQAATAGAFALTLGLGAIAAIPEGYPVLFGSTLRADFATGLGLMGSTLGALTGLGLSTFLDISHGRMLASSGVALATGSMALATAYLIPIAFDDIPGVPITRARIAAGLGLVVGWAAGAATFVLLPDSWANFFEKSRPKTTDAAVAVEEGELKLGLPTAWARPAGQQGKDVAVGVNLFGGSF